MAEEYDDSDWLQKDHVVEARTYEQGLEHVWMNAIVRHIWQSKNLVQVEYRGSSTNLKQKPREWLLKFDVRPVPEIWNWQMPFYKTGFIVDCYILGCWWIGQVMERICREDGEIDYDVYLRSYGGGIVSQYDRNDLRISLNFVAGKWEPTGQLAVGCFIKSQVAEIKSASVQKKKEKEPSKTREDYPYSKPETSNKWNQVYQRKRHKGSNGTAKAKAADLNPSCSRIQIITKNSKKTEQSPN